MTDTPNIACDCEARSWTRGNHHDRICRKYEPTVEEFEERHGHPRWVAFLGCAECSRDAMWKTQKDRSAQRGES